MPLSNDRDVDLAGRAGAAVDRGARGAKRIAVEDGSRAGISSRSHHLPTARCQRTRDHEHLGLPLASLIHPQDNEETA
jgi:hypothetical protein